MKNTEVLTLAYTIIKVHLQTMHKILKNQTFFVQLLYVYKMKL